MSSRRRKLLAPEIRRKGGEVTDDPSIATHCIVTPFTVDEERMKELCAKYGVPDTCKRVPESFLFTDPDVLQEREAALAQTTDGGRQKRVRGEAISHTDEHMRDASNWANNLRVAREGSVAGDGPVASSS